MNNLSEGIQIALIINHLVYQNEYNKDELNGIRKFLEDYVKKEHIANIADDLGLKTEE